MHLIKRHKESCSPSNRRLQRVPAVQKLTHFSLYPFAFLWLPSVPLLAFHDFHWKILLWRKPDMGKLLVSFMNISQTVSTARGERWFVDLKGRGETALSSSNWSKCWIDTHRTNICYTNITTCWLFIVLSPRILGWQVNSFCCLIALDYYKLFPWEEHEVSYNLLSLIWGAQKSLF